MPRDTEHIPGRLDERYGLRCSIGGEVVRLLQLGGSGRLRVGTADRAWWTKRRSDLRWEVYRAEEGETFPSEAAAQIVVSNITG